MFGCICYLFVLKMHEYIQILVVTNLYNLEIILLTYLWWYSDLNLGPGAYRKVLYHLNHSPSPLCFVIFQVVSHVFAQSQRCLQSSYICPFGDYRPSLLIEMGFC
jgi:hypothetical protein